jgi:hypothetical protein
VRLIPLDSHQCSSRERVSYNITRSLHPTEFLHTAASKGPPDHRLSKFRFSVSAPAGPKGIAPRRPFPNGYAVRIMSDAFAGEVDHNGFAEEQKGYHETARARVLPSCPMARNKRTVQFSTPGQACIRPYMYQILVGVRCDRALTVGRFSHDYNFCFEHDWCVDANNKTRGNTSGILNITIEVVGTICGVNSLSFGARG